MEEQVNHPNYYMNQQIECIDVAETLSFNLGSALKYLWRSGKKGDMITDLRKSVWYLNREIERLQKQVVDNHK
jgi:hypothetical protein